MDKLEKVEKLRQKADISYEEARDILEKCGWDLLDAVVKLENEGKIDRGENSDYTTAGSSASDAAPDPKEVAESYSSYKGHESSTKGFFASLWKGIRYLIKKGCENEFVVKRYKEPVFSVPVLVLVIMMILFFWLLLILMAIGLFFGFGYSFKGPDLGVDSVNDVMDKASRVAEDIKAEMTETDDEDKNDDRKSEKDTDNRR